MTGIVEPHACASFAVGPAIERFCLGTFHVGLKPAEPEQARALACTGPNGNGSLWQGLYDERNEASFIHGWFNGRR
jgi:hypothetical protein